MPHEHVKLAQAPNGEIGPRCHDCDRRLTFGSSMVHNEHYYCWEHYVEKTGADSVTEVSSTEQKFYIKK